MKQRKQVSLNTENIQILEKLGHGSISTGIEEIIFISKELLKEAENFPETASMAIRVYLKQLKD